MRLRIYATMVGLALCAVGTAGAQEVSLNHLDCRYDDATHSLKCPDVFVGRASADIPAPAPAAPANTAGTPAQGSPEWNAACAAKYKSFDAATGMYKSFSGQMRPCV